MSEWRYAVEHDAVNNHTTITRGRTYHVGDSDSWHTYWESTDIVAFYDEGYRGLRGADWCDEDEARRATVAYSAEQDNLPGSEGALKRLAVRLTGTTHFRDQPADFIRVGLDRGIDFYVLSWNGDPDRQWRDEIEEVWHGEVYRIECEEYTLIGHAGGEDLWEWTPADDACDEWYGLDNALDALAEAFPETEFPAEKIVPDNGE